MSDNVYVVIIRKRNQITIPSEIVEKKPWLAPGSPVLITTYKNKIVIEPYLSKAPDKD